MTFLQQTNRPRPPQGLYDPEFLTDDRLWHVSCETRVMRHVSCEKHTMLLRLADDLKQGPVLGVMGYLGEINAHSHCLRSGLRHKPTSAMAK
jgi:hypothetical protein